MEDHSVITYAWKTLHRAQECELHSDGIVVRGTQTLGSRFETSVSLNKLDSQYTRLWYRTHNSWIAVASGLLCVVLVEVIAWGADASRLGPVAVVYAISAGLVLYGLAIMPRVEYARFHSKEGHPLLDIGRAGPRKGEFDAFIAAVVDQIDKVHDES